MTFPDRLVPKTSGNVPFSAMTYDLPNAQTHPAEGLASQTGVTSAHLGAMKHTAPCFSEMVASESSQGLWNYFNDIVGQLRVFALIPRLIVRISSSLEKVNSMLTIY